METFAIYTSLIVCRKANVGIADLASDAGTRRAIGGRDEARAAREAKSSHQLAFSAMPVCHSSPSLNTID
jgi:hypothetical protein